MGKDELFSNTTAALGSGTRTLEVHYKTWDVRIQVIDPSTQQQLYSLSGDGLGTHIQALNAHGQVVGNGRTSHNHSSVTVDMTGTGNPFSTHTGKSFGRGSPAYVSPAFKGQKMTWKNKAMSSKINYTLVDASGLALARFESAGMSLKRVGKLEIMESVTEQAQVDEIVVTVLTLMYRKLVAMNFAAIV